MSDSKLLMDGYEALSEAHRTAGLVVQQVHDLQEMGTALPKAEALRQFAAIRERAQKAVCAFTALESRAKGCEAPKVG